MLRDFIRGKSKILLWDIAITAISFLILKLSGTSLDILIVVVILKGIMVLFYLFLEYLSYNKKMKKIKDLKENMDKGYYVHEIIQRPKDPEQVIYFDLMVKANQDMVTELAKYRGEYVDYREYIEEWIHEMKTPLTTIGMLNTEDKDYPKKLNRQLKKISDLLETSLYYIRSNSLEKDYQVEKLVLKDLIHKVILREKDLLLLKKIELEVHCNVDFIIYSDEKWISFIIHQILLNAIKYVNVNGKIKINVLKKKDSILLRIWDNGCGIKAAHLPRIFDKGFTAAENQREKASGIGLYLVKKCADKMGIKVMAQSEDTQYTQITLEFPYYGKRSQINKNI